MDGFHAAKRAFIASTFIRGLFEGSVDEVVVTFTDSEITRFYDTSEILKNCEPWSNHLKDEAYPLINRALRRKNYQAARLAIIDHATKTANPHCLTILKTAMIEVCTKCTTIIREALPRKINVPKF